VAGRAFGHIETFSPNHRGLFLDTWHISRTLIPFDKVVDNWYRYAGCKIKLMWYTDRVRFLHSAEHKVGHVEIFFPANCLACYSNVTGVKKQMFNHVFASESGSRFLIHLKIL